MKVEWLNDELTLARLTEGHLWWKRVALVEREVENLNYATTYNYRYRPSGDVLGQYVQDLLEKHRNGVFSERHRVRISKNWVKPSEEGPLPTAKLVKEKP